MSKDMMRAAILKEWNHFEVEQVERPQISAPDDIIAKVLVCSICGTDVNLSKGPGSSYGEMRGRILGHEIVGEVVETGSAVRGFQIGDRIVVNPNTYCCTCDACRAGYRNHCQNMKLMGITTPGGFAEYVKIEEKQAFHISKDVPLDEAAFAEPMSCAMNGFSRLDIHPGETCVVFGCGPIGLMFAQLARKSGGRVVCVEIKPNRLEKARSLGFTAFDPNELEKEGKTLKEELIRLWGRRANFTIDAAGGQLPTAIEVAEYRAKLLCFANARLREMGNLGPIQGKELTVMGSFIINDSMPKAITVLENRMLDLQPIVTHHLPLEELDRGMELMKSGEGMEIIIDIAQEG